MTTTAIPQLLERGLGFDPEQPHSFVVVDPFVFGRIGCLSQAGDALLNQLVKGSFFQTDDLHDVGAKR